jgi:hypothetical protein
MGAEESILYDLDGDRGRSMIYCVVPEELAPELYDRLAEYYAEDPHVEVIVDRRKGRERRASGTGGGKRRVRDRRRPRVPSEFPKV